MGKIGIFDDELFAWLMFDHFRSDRALRGRSMYLTSQELSGRPQYSVYLQLSGPLENVLGMLYRLRRDHVISDADWACVTPDSLENLRKETALFNDAYNGPAKLALETIPAAQLQRYLRRFIRFKSVTDPRIHRPSETSAAPLSGNEANQLAADIIAVAGFYRLPLDIFLGIGAMENNYMNVRGDLLNTGWKRRAESGDIVLRRRRGGVLVRNDSQGVWQITRESLRYAHRLYVKDKRDYSLLPERLRPPSKLDINHVNSEVLTTYAGLLLSDLIDQFHGDATLAVGAYNGGIGFPNLKYAAGVETVASYARRVLERAAAIQGAAMSNANVNVRE